MKPLLTVIVLFTAALLYAGRLSAQQQPAGGIARKQLLQQVLPATCIEEVRIDEITCGPGQGAPEHHHPGEVYGYVTEGEIVYQVYGEAPVRLHAGDSFREPAGRRILVFKNALADRPSKFIAVYLLKKGQAPIVIHQ